MPYFSGPNGIREVADAGDRFQQSFNTARRGKLLSDFFTNGQTDLGALARLDPEAAQQIQAQQKDKQVGGYLSQLLLAPEEQRTSLLAQVMGLDRKAGMEAVKTFDPRHAGSGMPSELQTFNAMTAGMGKDDISEARRIQLGLAPRKSSAAIQYKETTLPDGRKAWVAFDPREVGSQIMGTGETYGSGVGANKPYQPGAVVGTPYAGAARVNIQGIDPAKQGQIANAVAAMEAAGIGEDTIHAFVTSQFQDDQPEQGGSLVGPSEAQLAANKRAAEAGVDLQYQPQLEQAKADVQYGNMGRVGVMDAQNAGLKATEEARAKSAVEQALKVSVRARDDREQLMLLSEAAGLLKKATSGGAAELGRDTARYFGVTTEGAKADAQLETIAGKLTGKVPRFEGPQSNIDVQLYQKMAGDLANAKKTRGERIAAAQGMVNLIKKYQDYAAQQKAPQQPARPGGKLVFNPATGDFD